MTLLDEILKFNQSYIEDENNSYVDTDTKCSKMPSREMAIVTCMDTRLVNFWRMPWTLAVVKRKSLKQRVTV